VTPVAQDLHFLIDEHVPVALVGPIQNEGKYLVGGEDDLGGSPHLGVLDKLAGDRFSLTDGASMEHPVRWVARTSAKFLFYCFFYQFAGGLKYQDALPLPNQITGPRHKPARLARAARCRNEMNKDAPKSCVICCSRFGLPNSRIEAA
jgi:hypothetical protein